MTKFKAFEELPSPMDFSCPPWTFLFHVVAPHGVCRSRCPFPVSRFAVPSSVCVSRTASCRACCVEPKQIQASRLGRMCCTARSPMGPRRRLMRSWNEQRNSGAPRYNSLPTGMPTGHALPQVLPNTLLRRTSPASSAESMTGTVTAMCVLVRTAGWWATRQNSPNATPLNLAEEPRRRTTLVGAAAHPVQQDLIGTTLARD